MNGHIFPNQRWIPLDWDDWIKSEWGSLEWFPHYQENCEKMAEVDSPDMIYGTTSVPASSGVSVRYQFVTQTAQRRFTPLANLPQYFSQPRRNSNIFASIINVTRFENLPQIITDCQFETHQNDVSTLLIYKQHLMRNNDHGGNIDNKLLTVVRCFTIDHSWYFSVNGGRYSTWLRENLDIGNAFFLFRFWKFWCHLPLIPIRLPANMRRFIGAMKCPYLDLKELTKGRPSFQIHLADSDRN